ncbi:hypothetical protein M434DRAFT_248493 [Hypoxylon sp. CO27-5]|nr:hypothetical protein M434DRAFT_248493 [Hypoxylon sp. CO27-5]
MTRSKLSHLHTITLLLSAFIRSLKLQVAADPKASSRYLAQPRISTLTPQALSSYHKREMNFESSGPNSAESDSAERLHNQIPASG